MNEHPEMAKKVALPLITRETIGYWTRWVFVLPAAFIAAVVVKLFTSGDWPLSALPIRWGFQSYAMVYAGGKTAPKHHFITGIAIAMLQAILIGADMTLSRMRLTREPFWLWVMSGATGLVGSAWALQQLYRGEKLT